MEKVLYGERIIQKKNYVEKILSEEGTYIKKRYIRKRNYIRREQY